MNEARFSSIFNGLTTVAKKVFEAVPIGDAWTAQQIRSELIRQGSMRDAHIVSGCINTLVNAGLIIERPRGSFRRVEILKKFESSISSESVNEAPRKEPKTMTLPSKPQQDISSIDRLAILARQLKLLAGELETAAIEIEEQNAANAEGRKKLQQLQELLKGTI